jgi:hypothetical protein
MRRLILVLAATAWLAFGLVPPASADGQLSTVTLVLADEGGPGGATERNRQPNGESPNFKLIDDMRPFIRWYPGPRVEYRVINEPIKGAQHALVQSEKTLDPFITTRQFKRDDKTTQINPCTGAPNTLTWGLTANPNNVAETSLCIATTTRADGKVTRREIVGWVTIFDSRRPWATDGDRNAYDIENVATHEWGHVAGLDHVSAPEDRCLTMYFQTSRGETEQRTLGWGDKRGLDKLYDTGDTSPGPGCGR